MIKLIAIGVFSLLLIGCMQLQQPSNAENVCVYRMAKEKNPDILLRLSFSFDWIEDVFEMEAPFVKEEVDNLQSAPQTLKARQHADGTDFWCDSTTLLTHESPEDVKVMFSYAYSHSIDEIKGNGQIDFHIPFGTDGQSEAGEISYKWKWITRK